MRRAASEASNSNRARRVRRGRGRRQYTDRLAAESDARTRRDIMPRVRATHSTPPSAPFARPTILIQPNTHLNAMTSTAPACKSITSIVCGPAGRSTGLRIPISAANGLRRLVRTFCAKARATTILRAENRDGARGTIERGLVETTLWAGGGDDLDGRAYNVGGECSEQRANDRRGGARRQRIGGKWGEAQEIISRALLRSRYQRRQAFGI